MKIMYGKAVLGMAKKRHICRKESGSFVRKYRLSLLSKFKWGNGEELKFDKNSRMSNILSDDDAFEDLAEQFEEKVKEYYNVNKNLDGFDGDEVLKTIGLPYVKDTWFMHTVMGGTQGIKTKVTLSPSGEITILYQLFDHYGAGTNDGKSSLPGLPSMYWLQHESGKAKFNYMPFVWSIQVERKIEK